MVYTERYIERIQRDSLCIISNSISTMDKWSERTLTGKKKREREIDRKEEKKRGGGKHLIRERIFYFRSKGFLRAGKDAEGFGGEDSR